MATKKLTLLGGLLIAVLALTAGAEDVQTSYYLDFDSPMTEFPLGEEIMFEVEVDPLLVGGLAELDSEVDGVQYNHGLIFDLQAPAFPLHVTNVDNPAYVDKMITYQFLAFTPGGEPAGWSPPVEARLTPPVEWDWD